MSTDYFTTLEEATQFKPFNTNPKYPHFKQQHFTAGDEEQFFVHSTNFPNEHGKKDDDEKLINEMKTLTINNRFQYNTIRYAEWIKYSQHRDCIIDTFRYIFYKLKKGIFVKIQDNQLKVFLPFSNANFTNEWGHLIKLSPQFSKHGDLTYDLRMFFKYMYDQVGNNFNTRFELDPSKWYANNGVFKVEKDSEGDSVVSVYADMLRTLCQSRKVKDCHFFLNRRDHPILSDHGVEPYDNIFGENTPLVSHSYPKYTPIISPCTREGYADILMVNSDDWTRVNFGKKYFVDMLDRDFSLTPTPWEQRKPTAVFRGSSTGEYTTIERNPRIRLALMSNTQDKKKKYLDCGITRWNPRCRKTKDDPMLQIVEVLKLNIPTVKHLSPTEQATFKYLIHLDGHTSAFRLGFELSFGCCILKPESRFKLWFSDMLKPYEHYVPINEDLSDLYKKIDWCRKNDKKCEIIAENAKTFFLKYLKNEECLLDYMEMMINKL